MAKVKEERCIFITDFDLRRLQDLITDPEVLTERNMKHIHELEVELRKAKVVASRGIPADVVTMNSKVCLEDLDSGDNLTITLTFPPDSDVDQSKISVLAPIGTAIIGYKINDVIEWKVPRGIRRLKIKKVLYQPESAGDFHL